MGIVKTEAQRKANRLRRERAVAASDAEAIRGPKLDEWSARMPAYAYTSLCPDERYRRKKKKIAVDTRQDDTTAKQCLSILYPTQAEKTRGGS